MIETPAMIFGTVGFGPENLPYGSCQFENGTIALSVRLGDHALALGELADAVGGLDRADDAVVRHENLDPLLAAGHETWSRVRFWLQAVVCSTEATDAVRMLARPLAGVTMRMPFSVSDYVDFYASEHHASNIGRMFRPHEPPLKPNWKYLPVGYHGRSSTFRVSGVNVSRPKGLRPEGGAAPSFGPSRRLDFCLLYTSPSPRDGLLSRMPSSA